jgi:D-glycero-D-manno-heptose 1,7-bisphosphate phosphatase
MYTLISPRPALFLDRDGIVIRDLGYVNSLEKTEFFDRTIELIGQAREKGFLVFIITNQAGVARGYYTEDELVSYNIWLLHELSRLNAEVDELVYCPSHPEYGEKRKCDCRKPGNEMLRYLSSKWNLDLQNSILLGDKDSDIDAGTSLGVRSIKWDPEDTQFQMISDLIRLSMKSVPREVEVIDNE